MAQSFPVFDTNMSQFDRIFKEGLEADGTFFWYPTSYNFNHVMTPDTDGATAGSSGNYSQSTPGVGVPLMTGSIDKGKIALITGLHLWASKDTFMRVDLGVAKGGFSGVVGRSGIYMNPYKMMYPQDSYFGQYQGIVDGGTDKIVGTASLFYWEASADMDYDAPFILEANGDSNCVGSFQGESEQLWHWIIRKWYRDRGIRIRVMDRSVGGQGSIHFEDYRKRRKLTAPVPPNIYFYALGTNDGSAPSTYQANAISMINWRLAQSPDTRVVIMGPLPKRGQETQMNLVRAAGQAAVDAVGNPRAIFINCGNIFDPTQDTYYVVPVDGTHINAAGHVLWAQAVIDGIIANDAVSDVKFGTFI